MSTDAQIPRRRRAPANDGLLIVGITGGMGAGKTTLVQHLVEGGAAVLSADAIGHEVLEDPAVRDELRAAFGAGILAADGHVDRALLGRLAFATPEALERLNAISHPRLLARLREKVEDIAADGFRGILLLEAALLVEWDLGAWCDVVVCVTAPLEDRMARVAGVRGWSLEETGRRIARQLPEEARVRYADRVLENDGGMEAFRRRADALRDELLDELRRRSS